MEEAEKEEGHQQAASLLLGITETRCEATVPSVGAVRGRSRTPLEGRSPQRLSSSFLFCRLHLTFFFLYIPEPERVLEEHVGFTQRQLMVLTRHRLAHESPESRSSGAGVHRRERRTGPGEKVLKAPFIYIFF